MSRESIYLDMTETKFVLLPHQSSEGKRTSLENGDILVSITADIGICSYVDGRLEKPAFINQHVALVRFDKNEIDSKYVAYFLSSENVQKLFKGAADQGAKAGMNLDAVRKIKTAIPSKLEQTAIANALSDADALINELEKLIAKKQAIKTATMQQLLTGRTRLPQFALREDGTPKAYKQSELGKIPEDWEVFAIRDLGDIVTGGTPSTSVIEYWNGDIPWITPSDINDSKDISNGERAISSLGLKSLRELPANTVLVTCIASIGKNAVLRKIGACNQQINAVIPRKTVNTDFLFYAIEQSKERLKASAGITATPIISKALFGEFLLVAPDIREQTAIATILSDMDEEIQTLQKRLAKTCQIKQGMMQELLTGRIRLISGKLTVESGK